jgi:antitoxin (DNA-binding transcriptional repressor) of toxin-antitoxin stability system
MPRTMKSKDVRANWAAIRRAAEQGRTTIIEHYDRPVARLVPYNDPATVHYRIQIKFFAERLVERARRHAASMRTSLRDKDRTVLWHAWAALDGPEDDLAALFAEIGYASYRQNNTYALLRDELPEPLLDLDRHRGDKWEADQYAPYSDNSLAVVWARLACRGHALQEIFSRVDPDWDPLAPGVRWGAADERGTTRAERIAAALEAAGIEEDRYFWCGGATNEEAAVLCESLGLPAPEPLEDIDKIMNNAPNAPRSGDTDDW